MPFVKLNGGQWVNANHVEMITLSLQKTKVIIGLAGGHEHSYFEDTSPAHATPEDWADTLAIMMTTAIEESN